MNTQLLSKNSGIELYEITNDNGLSVQIITYGARIFKLNVPNKEGKFIDVVAGFETPEGFFGENPYFNAVIGRVANRIGNASFTLNGKNYSLYKNDGNNHLHGGKEGFDRKIWKAQIVGANALRLGYLSPDGEENYPGNLQVYVTYRLTNDNKLTLSYEATCDRDTLCGLTNHAYFNLDGDFVSALDHEIFIRSDKMSVMDENLILHGESKQISGTPYDFSMPKAIGRDIGHDDFMLNKAKGYDFNYILTHEGDAPVASAYSAKSGILMEVFTDRPCMQLYTGNFLDGLKGKHTYNRQSAFCMETQGYPNACNVPSFPSMVLSEGEKYSTYTSYAFSVKE